MNRTRIVRSVVAAAAAVALLTSCSLLGGAEDHTDPPGKLETDKLTVGTLSAIESVTLWRAQQAGYFKDEGLEVTDRPQGSGPDAVAAAIAGDLDIGLTSYPAAISAQSKLGGQQSVRIVLDAYSAGPGGFAVVALATNTRVQNLRGLVGKKVAVSATGTISDLSLMSAMQVNKLDWRSVKFVPVPFAQMTTSLVRGDVDAAVMPEPVKQIAQLGGAQPIADLADGSNGVSEPPLSAWVSSGTFVHEHPNAVAAFTRAMGRAVADLNNREILNALLIKHIKGVDPDIANMADIGVFYTTATQDRTERVVRLMQQFGVLPADVPFDTDPMFHDTGTG